MTTAVCFHCGSIKLGAFMKCPKCGYQPIKDDDMVISLAMTDHYLQEDDLKKISQAMAQGIKPNIDDEFKKDLLKTIKSSEFRDLYPPNDVKTVNQVAKSPANEPVTTKTSEFSGSMIDLLFSIMTLNNLRLINPKNFGSDVFWATSPVAREYQKAFKLDLELEPESMHNIIKQCQINVSCLNINGVEQKVHFEVSDTRTIGYSKMTNEPRLLFYQNIDSINIRELNNLYRMLDLTPFLSYRVWLSISAAKARGMLRILYKNLNYKTDFVQGDYLLVSGETDKEILIYLDTSNTGLTINSIKKINRVRLIKNLKKLLVITIESPSKNSLILAKQEGIFIIDLYSFIYQLKYLFDLDVVKIYTASDENKILKGKDFTDYVFETGLLGKIVSEVFDGLFLYLENQKLNQEISRTESLGKVIFGSYKDLLDFSPVPIKIKESVIDNLIP